MQFYKGKSLRYAALFLACVATGLLVMKYYFKSEKAAFTLEWHEIAPQTRLAMQPIFEQLRLVSIEAFLPVIKPYVYAHDTRLANISFENIPTEKQQAIEQKVVADITESFLEDFDKKMNQLYSDLQNKQISAAYVVIARDDQQKIIGFSMLQEGSIKKKILDYLLTVLEGSPENIIADAAHDKVYVNWLAVMPGAQKKGVGKALLFSVFNHRPHIKKIYLKTHGHDFNKNAQTFYEHLGFTRMFKGIYENKIDYEREKIVYLYQKHD